VRRLVHPIVVGLLLVTACGKDRAAAPPTVEPTAAAEDDDYGEGSFAFVSTERNVESDDDDAPAAAANAYEGDPVVTTAARVHEIADAAVADRLNPRQQWESSPAMPAAWPKANRHVLVYFYPMAANPSSLAHFQLFSAAFAVDVSLDDGTGEVRELETRKLGVVEDTRPSRLEREERELAEKALVHYLLSGESGEGENAFWGYLKFFHEHPKIGNDVKRRHPSFIKWLEKRNGRR
jgi:hypothetical protein